jgi:nicotinamidase-related amidase
MNSSPNPRDPTRDHLLTPQNAALLVIDYQPTQVRSIQSRDRRSLVSNAVGVVRLARLFALPIVLSTVNVANGRNAPTIPSLTALLPDVVPIDRTTINAWEDDAFVRAVKATGRQNLLMLALWTEACLTFPALDALRDGYRVYPVVDAVGGTSLEAHDAALQRIVPAGAHPVSWVQLACELQRDWAREATVKGFAEILFSL